MIEPIRKDYAILHELEEIWLSEGKTKQEVENRPIIRDLKWRIRNYQHEYARRLEEDVNWRYAEYDSRWCKIVYESLPEEWYDIKMTREEAIKAYKEDEWWHRHNPYNDGRDCTGVWFTFFIKVFPIPELNKTIVYHYQSCDV